MASRVFTRQMLTTDAQRMTHDGQKAITKAHHEHVVTLVSTKVLQDYDLKKPVILAVDASIRGIGAAIIQQDRVVAYASPTAHEDSALNVTSTVFTSSRYFGTNILTKFHEDGTINMASRVFTRQMLTTDAQHMTHDTRRTKGDHKSSP
ncbi:hypothetical protein DPMN_028167 [Dreissena polymorpha]|uniref:Reverse transcriptase/retrotransposon-derived protein RNase H-like domain-containing protein n=1 Tax=Dreissena polymorpha TaxID=45954 RepID=A0A9D4LWQ6_DREPO|nr:hypothetical protein DPMN_028167 [Dreissena polymorpha]